MESSSHLVLARKWRPQHFSELVGQEHVTRTLVRALKHGRIAHAFLFTGIRGVGKTTAARILARCLNCAQGPTPEPCGSCAACHEIRAGSALDVVEIDGATYRKIDDARAIIENLSYRPSRDRFKIYIIDEAHQLTDQAFNALLKTLEEPPPHVKFILATTEPQKMPETILSRLQRYDFRRIPLAVIRERLRELAQREGIETDEAVLTLLAREAGGSMRDGERMLETALASLDGRLSEAEVAGLLGVAGRTRIVGLVRAILDQDAAVAMGIARELIRAGSNLESSGRDVLETLRNLAVARLPGGSGPNSPLADLADQEASELRQLASQASGRDLMRLFRLMADAQEQLTRSPYPDLILEMTVLRMATLAPVLDADELMRALGGSDPGAASGADADSSSSGTKQMTSVAAPRANRTQAATGSRRIPFQGEVKAEAPPRAAPQAAALPQTVSTPPDTPPPDLPDLRDFIRGRRAALAGFMEQGAILSLGGELLTITPRSDIYIRYLTDNRQVIAELASELYGRRIRAEISGVTPAAADETPAPVEQSRPPSADESSARRGNADASGELSGAKRGGTAAGSQPAKTQAEARQELYADPVVQRIFEQFDARLVEVKPVSRSSSSPSGPGKK